MENPVINNTTMIIEAIAMPAALGLVAGLLAKKLLRSFVLLGIVGLAMIVGLSLAGITRIDSNSLDAAKASVPLLQRLGAAVWQTVCSSPPSVTGACIGVALRMWMDARSRAHA